MSEIVRRVDGGWSWAVLVAASISMFVYGAFIYPFGVYVVTWQREFELSASEASVIISELTFTISIIAIFGGALCKRFRCRSVLLLTSLVATLSTFLTSFATQIWHLHVFTIVIGCLMGIAYICNIVIATYYFKKHIGIANGVIYSSVAIGALSMAPFTEFLCDIYGWKGSLMIYSGIISHVVVCALVYRPTELENASIAASKAPLVELRYEAVATDVKRSDTSVGCPTDIETDDFVTSTKFSTLTPCIKWLRVIDKAFDCSTLLTNMNFRVFMLSSTITTMCVTAFRYFMPSRLVFDLGVSTFHASLSITVYGASSAVTRIISGVIVDGGCISSTNLFIFTMAIIGVSSIVSPFVEILWVQLLLMALVGVGAGTFYPLISIISREFVPIEKLPNAIGWLFGVGGIGAIITSLTMGQLYDLTGSYSIPFFIVGIFQLMAILLMISVSWMRWRRRRNDVLEKQLTSQQGSISQNDRQGQYPDSITFADVEREDVDGRSVTEKISSG